MARIPEVRDRVFLGEQKTPFRVASIGSLRGEKAAGLIRQADYTEFNRLGEKAMPIVRWVPIADLVRDAAARGWRERWRQLDLPFPPKKKVGLGAVAAWLEAGGTTGDGNTGA